MFFRVLRGITAVTVVLYVLALLALVLALRVYGERTWWLMVLLYSPRLVFLLPMVVLVPMVLALRQKKSMVVLAIGLVIALFPLGGLTIAGWRSPRTAALDVPADRAPLHALRVFSHNVWFGRGGVPPIVEAIGRAQPDVVALQGVNQRTAKALKAQLPGWTFYVGPDLLVATKLPVESIYEPPPFSLSATNSAMAADPDTPLPLSDLIDDDDADANTAARDARSNQPALFVRLTLTTAWGPVDFYDLHPYSPRHAIEDLRGDGWRSVLLHGVAPAAERVWARNTAIRAEQVRRLAADIDQRVHPVVLAGDSNLPSDSAIFRRYLARFGDGFGQRGVGLGYTFPAHRRFRWLRIDRVLAGPGTRMIDFAVLDKTGSDHRPILADVEIIGR